MVFFLQISAVYADMGEQTGPAKHMSSALSTSTNKKLLNESLSSCNT